MGYTVRFHVTLKRFSGTGWDRPGNTLQRSPDLSRRFPEAEELNARTPSMHKALHPCNRMYRGIVPLK